MRLWAQARARSAPWLALLLIPLLGALLHQTGGAFQSWAVPALLAGTVLWALFAAGSDAPTPSGRAFHALLILLLIAEALIVARDPHILYVRSPLRALVLKRALIGFVLVSMALALWSLSKWARGTDARWFWGGLGFLFAARVCVLPISPSPFIDVFTSGTLGAEHFWNGLNPYAQTYPDIYRGAYGYNPTFFYAPAYLVWSSLAYLLGDIRWATILAEALTVGALLGFAREQAAPHTARLLWLLWSCFPVYLFMVEQTWIDPIVLATVAWGLRALALRNFAWAGAAFGLGLGVKQSLLLMDVLALAWVLRVAGLRAALRFGAGAALTAGAVYVPFLLWDAQAIINALVTTILKSPNRMDALTFNAWFHHLGFADASRWFSRFSIAFNLGAAAWLAARAQRLSDLTSVAALCYLVVFLCGYQAFCNYYWFVGGLVALDLLVRIPRAAAPLTTADS